MLMTINVSSKDTLYILSNDLDAAEIFADAVKKLREEGRVKSDKPKGFVLTDKTWHYLALLGDGLLQPRQGLISKDYYRHMPQASYYKMLDILQISRSSTQGAMIRQLPIVPVDKLMRDELIIALNDTGEVEFRAVFEKLRLDWQDFPKLFACFYDLGLKPRLETGKNDYCSLFVGFPSLI